MIHLTSESGWYNYLTNNSIFHHKFSVLFKPHGQVILRRDMYKQITIKFYVTNLKKGPDRYGAMDGAMNNSRDRFKIEKYL